MPASRPRKAKPVEMRRTERLCRAFDHNHAISATAVPITRICQSRARNRSFCSEKLKGWRGGRFGVDIVTAQDSFEIGGLGSSAFQMLHRKRKYATFVS